MAARVLHIQGLPAFDKLETTILHFGAEVAATPEGPNGQWAKELSSAKKATWVNAGKGRMFPWEALAYEIGRIPGVPAVTRMPDCCVDRVVACREQVLEYIGKCNTFKSWKKEIALRSVALRKLDEDFDVGEEFLFTHAEPLCFKALRLDCLNCLGTAGNVVAYKEARECMG